MISGSFRFCITFVLLLVLSGCDGGDLTRSKAVRLIQINESFEIVRVKHEIAKDADFSKLTETGKIYFENQLLKSREITYTRSGFMGWRAVDRAFVELVVPTEKLVGFLDDVYRANWENHDKTIAGTGYKTFITHVADIKSVDVEGIRVDANDSNKRIVEMKLNVISTDVGKLFYAEEFSIPHVAEFVLYDDGWKFEKSLFDEAKAKSSFVKNDLYGYKSRETFESENLWRMHTLGIYSDNWKDIAIRLERSENYQTAGTAAWAYHDHGMQDKALSIYEDIVLPQVKETKNPKQIKSSNEYYEKLKNDESQLARLQRESKQTDDFASNKKAQIKALHELKELEKEAKAEKAARVKVERAKQREIDQREREAQKKEKKRISDLKKAATTKTKSFGKFTCQTVRPGKYAKSSVEITDVGYTALTDSYVERCGEAKFINQKGVLATGTCFGSYGHRMPCVGFKVSGIDYLKSEVLFENEADQMSFFDQANKALKFWRDKYAGIQDQS